MKSITKPMILLLTALAGFGVACGSSSDSSSSMSSTSSTGSGGGSCSGDMYKKYGDAAFKKVTDDLVMTAAGDMKVGHFFASIAADPSKVAAFEDSLDKFLVMAYGGPNNYTGPDMPTAHKGLNISSDDYDYFVGLIAMTLEADGVSPSDVTQCFAPVVTDPSFKASIVGK